MASSGRTFGKGRVLGAAKTTPERSSKRPELLSPSESSHSLNSQASNSKSSNDGSEDISAAVALQTAREAVEAASSRLVCPICNEEMVTLLQLNRHLDDDHKNLEDVEQDEVKTWFKTQMVKAKKFQPLAVLNQKLKGLEVFESNEDRKPLPPVPSGPTLHEPQSAPIDPEELVTREHWQRSMPGQLCADPMCGRRLGGTNGNVNCRKCGKLFCEEHTMYQMRLSRSANHEPVRGYWCRVCETCYKSREGYNDHNGFERNHMSDFASLRRKAIDRSYLDASRLEKRLTKLTQILADPRLEQDQSTLSYLWSFSGLSGAKTQQRLLEESVVDWQDDDTVANCPFCQQEFTQYTFRRHHCRTCGRVVCADIATNCSTDVPLDVARSSGDEANQEKATVVPVLVRMCKDCKHTLFSKSDFNTDISSDPVDQRAFRNLKQFESGIRLMLPRFQRLLSALQDPEVPPTQAQLAEATKVRRRLTDSFTQYDLASKRMRDLPTTSPTQKKLHEQIHIQASQFLHLHMLPLKSLPKTLKHATPHQSSHSRSSSLNSVSTVNGYLSPNQAANANASSRNRSPLIHAETSLLETSSQASSSRLTELEADETSARERLIVLEEQRFFVQEMLKDARRRRKMEETDALGRNVEDLTHEIEGVTAELTRIESEVRGIHTMGTP